MSIGIPIKVFHEAKGHIVTIELVTGEIYRGQLIETEDNMNCQMGNIIYTARDGRVSNLEQVYIRGSKIRFMILPDMLKNAPMFRNIDPSKVGGRGKGLGLQRALGGRGMGRGFGRPTRGVPRGMGRAPGGPPHGRGAPTWG